MTSVKHTKNDKIVPPMGAILHDFKMESLS